VVKSVVERLMDEIHGMELLYDIILLDVSVSKGRKTEGMPPYTASANFCPGLDIKGHGRNPEEALQYLKAGIISQYAPNHEEDKSFLDLPIYAELTGFPTLDLGRVRVYIPNSIKSPSPCGCEVMVGLSIDGDKGLNVSPEFNYCITHEQAYSMRALLELEKKVTGDWIECGDIGITSLIAADERILDINKALGIGGRGE